MNSINIESSVVKINPNKVRKLLVKTSLADLEKMTDNEIEHNDPKLTHRLADILVHCASRPTITGEELHELLSIIHNLMLLEILRKKRFVEYTLYKRHIKVTVLNYEKIMAMNLPPEIIGIT